ncbi:MAG: hypothetical protein WDN69_30410 [Aliidongia sp.]
MPATPLPTSVAALPFAERLLLWTMRAWVMGVHRRSSTEPQIRAAFTKAGTPDSTEDLERFMTRFAAGASRQIQVDCICKQEISDDERRLLDILSFLQQDRSFEAMILLRTMMTPNAAVAASWDAGRLADRLKAAGCLLAQRRRKPAATPSPARKRPGRDFPQPCIEMFRAL